MICLRLPARQLAAIFVGFSLAVLAHAPAHAADDALADRQTKAGAAIAPRGRGIGLHEGFEQAGLLRVEYGGVTVLDLTGLRGFDGG